MLKPSGQGRVNLDDTFLRMTFRCMSVLCITEVGNTEEQCRAGISTFCRNATPGTGVWVIDLLQYPAGGDLDGNIPLRDTSPATSDSLKNSASLCHNCWLSGGCSWEKGRLSSHEAVQHPGVLRAARSGVSGKAAQPTRLSSTW